MEDNVYKNNLPNHFQELRCSSTLSIGKLSSLLFGPVPIVGMPRYLQGQGNKLIPNCLASFLCTYKFLGRECDKQLVNINLFLTYVDNNQSTPLVSLINASFGEEETVISV